VGVASRPIIGKIRRGCADWQTIKVDLSDLNAFLAVARAKGFREGARASGSSASGLSEAVGRLEAQLGVRLLHRTTRSVVSTEAGDLLLERLGPALREVESALENAFRDKPAGTLRLNVPLSAARLVLPAVVPPFLSAYPDIRVEVVGEESFVGARMQAVDMASGWSRAVPSEEPVKMRFPSGLTATLSTGSM